MSADFANVVVLSNELYQEITEHPIPTDLEAVNVFASAPAVLDLLMWLTDRCFVAKSEEQIPLFGELGLAAQLGCVEYSRPRRFRAMLEQWLSTIRAAWPQCPATISPDGRSLRIAPASAVLPMRCLRFKLRLVTTRAKLRVRMAALAPSRHNSSMPQHAGSAQRSTRLLDAVPRRRSKAS